MAKLKIGFIGCGGIANQKHLPGMKQQVEKGRVELVAFCDLIPERAEKAAKEYDFERAAELRDLMFELKAELNG